MTVPHRPAALPPPLAATPQYPTPISGAPRRPMPLPKNTIRASQLAESQYPGRRISFRGTAGTFKGISFTASLALDGNGQTRTVPSTPHIHIVDDNGTNHHLGFHATDSVTLLES